MFQHIKENKPLPWVAFFLGMLPSIGEIAYPCQLIYSAGRKKGLAAQFIVIDMFN